jgi:cell division inhibitor SepF
MADRLKRMTAFILGPSAKADDDDFEPEYTGAVPGEEATDVVDMATAKPAGRERPRSVHQGTVTPLEPRRKPTLVRPLAMSEIAHFRPNSFSEAAKIGETFKDGVPIILNLTSTDEKQAQKLIDFASGMAFVTDGRLERITPRVFIIIPASVHLTEADKDQLTEAHRLRE